MRRLFWGVFSVETGQLASFIINCLILQENITFILELVKPIILFWSVHPWSFPLHKEHLVTIESLRQRYIKDSWVHISAKCFRNRLDQEGLAAFGLDLISSVLKSHVGLCNHMQCGMYTVLMKELGVDDIILVDGTEIAVRKSLAAECECKEKFHAGLKLRVAFSLKKQSFEHISVTQAVDSERAQVLPERYRYVLFIMDTGYCGHELENKIVASGNHFLIKGKTNTAGKVVSAWDEKGKYILTVVVTLRLLLKINTPA